MTDESMIPTVRVTPLVAFIVTIHVWFIGDLDRQLALQVLDLPLKLDERFLHRSHRFILVCHVIGTICHL